jgi:general stress protein 26
MVVRAAAAISSGVTLTRASLPHRLGVPVGGMGTETAGGSHRREGTAVTDERAKLIELMKDLPIGMMTTYGPTGPRSVPMARQQVEPSAELWFISARDTHHVDDLQRDPQVSLTFSSRDAWVAMTGRGYVVDDTAKLQELWNTFAEAWLPGGPEDPNAVLIRVDVDQAEYWDTPGGKIASVVSLVKTKLTGDTYDTEHGTVQP